jgi:hypothetical protein
MTATLTRAGYEQTKRKLARLEKRLAAIVARNDLKPLIQSEAMRSCRKMIAQYIREIRLYEKKHADAGSRT